MKRFLEEVEKEKGAIDQNWKDSRTSTYGTKVVNGAESVWETLKNRTKKQTEGRKLVTSAGEDGFVAWQKLTQRYEPGLGAMKGKVLADLSGMVKTPAKTPAETRAKLTELDQRIKMFEDIFDKKGDEEQY